jgi:hypothetical protein
MFYVVTVKGRFTSPEMIPKALLTWKWTAWEPSIRHVLLCKKHNDGNAVWAQTQISLHWRSSPAWGRLDTPRPGSVQVQVQRKVKCWLPVSVVFPSVGQIPLGDSSLLFLCLTTGVSELEKFVFNRWSPDLHVNGNKQDSERQGWCAFSQMCNLGAEKGYWSGKETSREAEDIRRQK